MGASGRSDDDHLEFLNQQFSVGVIRNRGHGFTGAIAQIGSLPSKTTKFAKTDLNRRLRPELSRAVSRGSKVVGSATGGAKRWRETLVYAKGTQKGCKPAAR